LPPSTQDFRRALFPCCYHVLSPFFPADPLEYRAQTCPGLPDSVLETGFHFSLQFTLLFQANLTLGAVPRPWCDSRRFATSVHLFSLNGLTSLFVVSTFPIHVLFSGHTRGSPFLFQGSSFLLIGGAQKFVFSSSARRCSVPSPLGKRTACCSFLQYNPAACVRGAGLFPPFLCRESACPSLIQQLAAETLLRPPHEDVRTTFFPLRHHSRASAAVEPSSSPYPAATV